MNLSSLSIGDPYTLLHMDLLQKVFYSLFKEKGILFREDILKEKVEYMFQANKTPRDIISTIAVFTVYGGTSMGNLKCLYVSSFTM